VSDKEINCLLFPGGGMNQDDSVLNYPKDNAGASTFEQGDYRYALNVRVGTTANDNYGALTNILSTSEITDVQVYNGSDWVTGSIPAGTNVCIGECEDPKNKCFYAFVYNSNGNHFISRVTKTTIRILLQWNGLNFKSDHIISSWVIGPYLGFTCKQIGGSVIGSIGDIANPPRIIDTTNIFELFANLTTSFSEYHISLSKWAPLSPPVPRQSIALSSQNLGYGRYQFCYRYIYIGGFRSTFSPPSFFYTNEFNGLSLAVELIIPGFIFDYNNRTATAFGHDDVRFYQFVEYIELAYRESSIDSWKLFQRYKVNSSGNTLFNFNNSGPISRIPSNEIAQPFDSVPFYAGCGESIDNRSILADTEDELQVPDFSVEDVSVVELSPFVNSWNGPASAFTTLSGSQQVELQQILNSKQFSFKARGIYKLGIVFQHWSGRTWQAISPDNWIYNIPIPSKNGSGLGPNTETSFALQFNIPSSITPPDGAVSYEIVRTNCLNIEFFIHGIANNFEFLQNDPNPLNDQLQTPEAIQSIKNDYFDNQALIVSGNSQDLNLSDRIVSSVSKRKTATNFTSCSLIYIDISNWFMPTKANAGGTSDHPNNNQFYTFLKGDRVRIYEVTVIGTIIEHDEEIVEYTGKGLIINKPSNMVFGAERTGPKITTNSDNSYFIEVYRKKPFNPDDDVTFYSMGEWYPVIQPGTNSRDFSKRDFRWSNPASVTVSTVAGNSVYNKMPISNGDVWIVSKTMYYDYFNISFPGTYPGSPPATFLNYQMNQDKNKSYDYWDHNNGRPYSAYRYIPKVFEKPTQARFGLRYLQDSVFNGINTFLDENQFIYPEEYGRIRRLVNTNNAQVESVGNILLALGEIEVWSIYVNRTTLEDLSGRTQVSISDKVLGSFNTLLGSFGTMNPESVGRKNGRVVWWSQRIGCWARYSRDGMTNISEVKMKNWFHEISDLIDDTYGATPARCVSVFDDFYDEWITYVTHPDMPTTFRGYDSYKCATFSEQDKQWKAVYDYAADYFTYIGSTVYSLIGGRVIAHEQGSDYGKFYGTPRFSKWQPVANVLPRNSKAWRAIEEVATNKWSAQVIGDWRSNNATRQQSTILLSDLQLMEGRYVAALMQDVNTPNVTNPEINGDEMRSRALLLMLTLDPAVDYLTVFNYLNVKASDSPKNPKN